MLWKMISFMFKIIFNLIKDVKDYLESKEDYQTAILEKKAEWL